MLQQLSHGGSYYLWNCRKGQAVACCINCIRPYYTYYI